MSSMFRGCQGLTGIAVPFNTAKVTDMSEMFNCCKAIKYLNLTSFNTTNVMNMTEMFMDCISLTTIKCEDRWEYCTSSKMFSGCVKIKGAVAFDPKKITAVMANPITGYFTNSDTTSPYLPSITEHDFLSIGYNSVSIKWQPALDNRTPLSQLVYKLYMKKSINAEYELVKLQIGESEFYIQDLEEGTKYWVSLQVFDNSQNYSEYPPATFTTKVYDEESPTLPENTDATITNLAKTSIDIKWEPATDNKTPQNQLVYKLYIGNSEDAEFEMIKEQIGNSKFHIDELQEATTYWTYLQVVDNNLNHTNYPLTSFTTKATDLEKPTLPTNTDATISNITKNSINIKWEPSTDNYTEQDKLKYFLYIAKINVTTSDLKGTATGNPEFYVDELEANTEYRAILSVSDESYNYAYYPSISFTTLEGPAIYDLTICGTTVTSENCDNLSVINGVSGTVTYDNATKTLKLKKATILAMGKTSLSSNIDGLTIQLEGDNNILSSSRGLGMRINKPLTIEGSGTLTVTSEEYAIYADKAELTIKDCTVNAMGKYAGISGNEDEHHYFKIDNAIVTATGTTKGSIINFNFYNTATNCAIVDPINAEFNNTVNAVCDPEGNILTRKVTIKPVDYYNISICGKRVHSANCNDLSYINGVAGNVSYNPDTNTLTLKDATINTTENAIASNRDFTINIEGVVSVTSEKGNALFLTGAATISGSNRDKLNAVSSQVCGIEMRNLSIKDCNVSTKGIWGIAGVDGTTETLNIDNAMVEAEGTKGSIIDISKFNLNNCIITQPAGAVWNENKKAVTDADGNIINTKIVINRNTTGLEAVTTDVSATKQGIYNLQGMKLNTTFDRLPAGVYIVDGKKVVKK